MVGISLSLFDKSIQRKQIEAINVLRKKGASEEAKRQAAFDVIMSHSVITIGGQHSGGV